MMTVASISVESFTYFLELSSCGVLSLLSLVPFLTNINGPFSFSPWMSVFRSYSEGNIKS